MIKYCCSLICDLGVEEKLLDILLTTFPDDIFTSTPIFSHGTAHGRLSADEQVIGRSRSIYLQIVVSEPELAQLLELLRSEFAGTGIRYWTALLAAEGEIA